MLYSKGTGGFYDPKIHGKAIPPDVVEISADEYAGLMQAQTAGKQIQGGQNGKPIAVDRPAPTNSELVIAKIVALEATVTARRAREAILGADGGWLKNINDQIAALRTLLKP